MSKKVLAVIPARGGSKGIKAKNIKVVYGKPLIAYTIEAAKNSKLISTYIVSTESEDIKTVSLEYGAQVPFIRPEELATDMAASLPVIQHAVRIMEEKEKCRYDAIIMLQPTCPLRTDEDIDVCINTLFATGADSVISVVDVGAHHPLRMKRIVSGDRLINYIEQGSEDMRPRQVLPPTYIRNGAIYIVKRDVIMEGHSFVGEDCRAYIMSIERSVNIDAPEDLILAEYYLQLRRK